MNPSEKTHREFTDGSELIPLEPLDIESVSSFSELLESMEKTAFTGRQLGRAYEILTEMFTQKEFLTVLTLSGALTVAKQGLIICSLIEKGCVDIVVSTGALLTHGLIEGMGVQHFMTDGMDDQTAYSKGYNRVYDTIELEKSLASLESLIGENLHRLFPALTGNAPPAGSADFCRRLGELSLEKFPEERNILAAAAQADVPVYIPAFTDCELSLDICLQHIQRTDGFHADVFSSTSLVPFNPFVDLLDYSRRISDHTGKLGIFTLGGGVPRNWAQQVAPLIDIMIRDGFPLENRIFERGVRICPEPVHWGGLSGCTYREGVSWGKFLPEEQGGKYAEVASEVTSVLPLLIKAVFERMEKDGFSG